MTVVYNRARKALEDADNRVARAPVVLTPSDKGFLGLDENEWLCAHVTAKAVADEAVLTSEAVNKLQRLVNKARTDREYAKAVAARIETAWAVWATAYGRAMPNKFRKGNFR
jgi:hypothetical protein